MRKTPKQFIIYWTSKFSGENPGSTTEKFKANMKSYDDFNKAKEMHTKLVELQKIGGCFGSRIVHHVGAFNG